jgi:hypothetical protein
VKGVLMKSVGIMAGVVLAMTGNCLYAAPAKTVKLASPVQQAVKPNAPIAVPWAPKPFVDADRISASFRGEDIEKFFSVFERAEAQLKKDEFETSAQYAQRVANASDLILPVKMGDIYAFNYDIDYKYDADKQFWHFGQDYKNCSDGGLAYEADVPKDYNFCKIQQKTDID